MRRQASLGTQHTKSTPMGVVGAPCGIRRRASLPTRLLLLAVLALTCLLACAATAPLSFVRLPVPFAADRGRFALARRRVARLSGRGQGSAPNVLGGFAGLEDGLNFTIGDTDDG